MTERTAAAANPARRRLLCATALGTWTLLGASGVSGATAASPDDASAFARNFDGMRLVDQDGRPFRFDALRRQVLLVNFVYTGCSSICPAQTHVLAEVQRALPPPQRAGIHFVSVSLDPLSDTPAALKAFARRMGADLSGWSFVTGAPDDLERVASALRLFRPGAKRPDDHATALWLVDARGRLVQRLAGNPSDPTRLVRELVALRTATTG